MLNIERFYELMKEKDVVNIAQLSKETGVPYTTIAYMLTGHDMYVGTLIEICKFFSVPVDYLINKSYGIGLYTANSSEYLETTNIYEVLVSRML